MAKTLDEAGVKRLIQEIKGANKNLNTPIPISIENTPESMAQNVQNIADYIEKAKAAGIANVNGMGVTVLINDTDFSSGVGYFYKYDNDDNFIYIFGLSFIDFSDIEFKDEACVFAVGSDGQYFQTPLITVLSENVVTSQMLTKGARNPIIFTTGMAEVDEETYQKLLRDDVDVVFKTAGDNLCTFTYKYDNGTSWDFYFSCFSFEEESIGDIYIYAYEVNILKESIHKCTIRTLFEELPFGGLLDKVGYIDKSTLYSALEEVDLTGTDAERLAKLKNFENIWKDLTGASDLRGARFVGYVDNTDNSGTCSVLFTFNYGSKVLYQGCVMESDTDKKIVKYTLNKNDGSLVLNPLFSHLEAITIYTDNTEAHMQANLDNIAAYEANLQALGVDTSNGYMMPCMVQGDNWGGYLSSLGSGYFSGFYRDDVTGAYAFRINGDGLFIDYALALLENLDSKVDKSLNAKSLEAITIKTGNTTTDKEANKAAIQAYVDNLKVLGVDTTKGYMVPIKLDNGYPGFIMGTDADGEHTGVIKRGIYNFGGGWIYIDNIGTYKYLECLTLGFYNNLTTTTQFIIPAINEVNTLAKAVKAFGAIELKASDNDSNKAAITAYLKILTDAGVSTTNGYAVPVRITGNSQEYHGMLNIGTGVLLSGVVTDVNENHHYPFNVSTTDGAILFDENNYFLEKTSNEVTEMLDAIKYSYTSVPFTDTTLSNKAQLEVFLSKVPNATVMHCTYNEIWAGTLHKINGDWYGLLVKNTNSPADNINVKLSADGTIIKSNSAQ